VEPLILSLCYDQLPCGDLGCSCPRKFVDDGSLGSSLEGDECCVCVCVCKFVEDCSLGSSLEGDECVVCVCVCKFVEDCSLGSSLEGDECVVCVCVCASSWGIARSAHHCKASTLGKKNIVSVPSIFAILKSSTYSGLVTI
jgi:hypothetical protein